MTIGAVMRGTRTKQGLRNERQPSSSQTKSFTRDVGLSKNVAASITFVGGGTNQLQAAGGTFAAFAAQDEILVEGVNLNNGYFTVLSTDGSTQLTVDPPPKAEGPLTATVRTV